MKIAIKHTFDIENSKMQLIFPSYFIYILIFCFD